jgi:hypothetical protein
VLGQLVNVLVAGQAAVLRRPCARLRRQAREIVAAHPIWSVHVTLLSHACIAYQSTNKVGWFCTARLRIVCCS